MASPTPLSPAAHELTNLIEQEATTLSPQIKALFLAVAAFWFALLTLITYVAALQGNHLAQHYLELAAAPIGTFLAGWLGVRSPFV